MNNGSYGRPTPKQLNQNNTIVPNKSTTLEEDDDNGADDDGTDVFNLERVANKRESKRSGESGGGSETDKKLRLDLENKLAEAQNLNKLIKQELDRMRDDHGQETRQLRDELSALQQGSRGARSGNADADLQSENDELRESLRRQRQVTDEVRREAQGFLQEMRVLSQQSGSTYEKQAEMEKTMEQLEREVREWRNRYSCAKT